MSAHHKYRTAITVTIAGVEYEWPAVIIYARQKGYRGDRTSPPEDDAVEIVAIKLLGPHGVQIDLPFAVEDKFNDDPEIISLLMDAWADDEAAAAEFRADARAEERMTGDDA